jgi:hypothetical protein
LLGRVAAKEQPANVDKAPEMHHIHQATPPAATAPAQPQPTVEMEDALRRSALRGTNAVRAAATVAMERASSSLKSTVGEARVGLEKKSSVVQDQVTARLMTLSDQANAVRQSASDTVAQSAEHLTDKVSSQATAAKEVISARAGDAAASAFQAAPRMAAAATRVASDNVKGAADNLIHEARETRDRAFQWVWWWSLAAVGIYGFASSLPREVIRYYAAQDGSSSLGEEASAKDDRKRTTGKNKEIARRQENGQLSPTSDSSTTRGYFWNHRAVDRILRRSSVSGDLDK